MAAGRKKPNARSMNGCISCNVLIKNRVDIGLQACFLQVSTLEANCLGQGAWRRSGRPDIDDKRTARNGQSNISTG